jgi:hypothetical protein
LTTSLQAGCSTAARQAQPAEDNRGTRAKPQTQRRTPPLDPAQHESHHQHADADPPTSGPITLAERRSYQAGERQKNAGTVNVVGTINCRFDRTGSPAAVANLTSWMTLRKGTVPIQNRGPFKTYGQSSLQANVYALNCVNA